MTDSEIAFMIGSVMGFGVGLFISGLVAWGYYMCGEGNRPIIVMPDPEKTITGGDIAWKVI